MKGNVELLDMYMCIVFALLSLSLLSSSLLSSVSTRKCLACKRFSAMREIRRGRIMIVQLSSVQCEGDPDPGGASIDLKVPLVIKFHEK